MLRNFSCSSLSNSKFIYTAHLFPLALLVPLSRTAQRVLSVYALMLFVAALPIATYAFGQSAEPEPAPPKVQHFS